MPDSHVIDPACGLYRASSTVHQNSRFMQAVCQCDHPFYGQSPLVQIANMLSLLQKFGSQPLSCAGSPNCHDMSLTSPLLDQLMELEMGPRTLKQPLTLNFLQEV